MTTLEAPPLHALLVGIERYPGSELYPDLQGCAHDVQAIERYLVDVLAVPPSRIETLISGASVSVGPPPTYDHLTAALRRLEARCRPGDHALVHYSGHGGRTPTEFPEVKGPAAKDECLVPLDITEAETPYLRDAEIDLWVCRLVEREVFVTLILDCCHSGGMRRKTDPRVRGGKREDRTPRPLGEGLIRPEERDRVSEPVTRFASPWDGRAGQRGQRVSMPIFRHAGVTKETRAASSGYALFAACRHWEKAREDLFDGVRPSGALTYFLLRALQRLGPEATYRQLHEAVVAGVHSRFRGQTPVFEGETRALPLGHRRLPQTWGVEVLDVLPPDEAEGARRVVLAAGRCQRVAEGARFGIHPLTGSREGAVREAPVVTAEVEEAGAASCRAVLARRDAPVRPGDRAVLEDPGAREARWRVGLPRPVSRAETKLVAELDRRLTTGTSVRLADAGDLPADLSFSFRRETIDGGEAGSSAPRVELCDPSGVPWPHLPELQLGEPALADRLWAVLEHLARYESVRVLKNADFVSPLLGMVELRFEPALEEYPPEVETGHALCLVAENRSHLPLHLVLLDLQPDWGISQICPADGGSVMVDPHGRWPFHLQSSLPAGLDQGTDVLKLLAATEPLDCRWMELPPLVGEGADAGGAPGRPRAWRSGTWRSVQRSGPASEPAHAWVTVQKELRVVRP